MQASYGGCLARKNIHLAYVRMPKTLLKNFFIMHREGLYTVYILMKHVIYDDVVRVSHV